MSRNSRKLNKPQTTNHNQPAPVQSAPKVDNSNPFGLSFVVPTEDVALPSEGNFYPASSPLCGVTTVEIKHMTAKEEDLLTSLGPDTGDNVFNTLINSLVTNKTLRAEDMLEEDKMALLLSARRTGYGKDYKSILPCEACGTESEHLFDLTKSGIEPPANSIEFDPETATYSLDLPVSKLSAQVRSLTDKETKDLETEKRKKKDLGIPFNNTVSFLKRMLVSANGVSDPEALAKLIDILPAADAKKILNFNVGIYPRVSTKQEVSCGNCGNTSEREVPLTWAFFRIDI